MCACVRARACVRACVRVCVRACVCVCVLDSSDPYSLRSRDVPNVFAFRRTGVTLILKKKNSGGGGGGGVMQVSCTTTKTRVSYGNSRTACRSSLVSSGGYIMYF